MHLSNYHRMNIWLSFKSRSRSWSAPQKLPSQPLKCTALPSAWKIAWQWASVPALCMFTYLFLQLALLAFPWTVRKYTSKGGWNVETSCSHYSTSTFFNSWLISFHLQSPPLSHHGSFYRKWYLLHPLIHRHFSVYLENTGTL